MPRKKVEVVELNKKKEQIILEEKQSALTVFWVNNRLLVFLTLSILSFSVLVAGVMLTVKNVHSSENPMIKKVSIDVSLDDYVANVVGVDTSLTPETAKKRFLSKSSSFANSGEVLLVKKVDHSRYTIRFYSDGSAIRMMKATGKITRIGALEDGSYGVSSDGAISDAAEVSEITIKDIKTYSWGMVTYYSDGSAEVSNSKMDMFVRNADDITNDYISSNKIAYFKKSKTVGIIRINYYYDGTIEVIKNKKSYLFRNENDIKISGTDVSFVNNNQAVLIDSKVMDDGKIVEYYDDGGAIIRDGNKAISVRKSNSIIIRDNNIYEIIDNIYVQVSKKKGNTTFYTNGSAVVNYNGRVYYVSENSDIKYSDDVISSIGENALPLSSETSVDGDNIKIFDTMAVVTTNKYIAIVPKDKVIIDSNGKLKSILTDEEDDDDLRSFTIHNNTNSTLKYRVVIERSDRTTLDPQYVRYMLSTKNSIVGPNKLNLNVWDDDVSDALSVTGINYLLLDSTIEAHDSDEISIMLWTDYDTIPNAMQDKYLYGTIKVYAWSE